MAEKPSRELYSFDVALEEEHEEQTTKKVKRKNKETGEMETVEKTVTKTSTKEVPVRVFLKKPTRTQIEDGDMFYSIWLNKFIKMGLLTRAMLAKKQVDIGGSLNEDEKVNYARLYLQLFEKQQNIIRYSAKERESMSNDEKERLEKAVSELALIRKRISDFEAAQASIFDHTADVKARNKTITWFLLHLATFNKHESGDDAESMPLFPGTSFDERYRKYQEADEEQEELFIKTIDRLSTVATIWYMSGVQTQDEFDTVLEQINQETNISESDLSAAQEEIQEQAEQAEQDVKKKEDKDVKKKEGEKAVEEDTPEPKKRRGRPKKAPVNES